MITDLRYAMSSHLRLILKVLKGFFEVATQENVSSSPKRRLFLMIIGIGLIGFLLLSILIVIFGHTNPPVVREPQWDSPQTRDLAERACFDCHSNETVWPWYSYVPPVSLQISHSVSEGRETLNFSDWDNVHGEGGRYHEMAEKIEQGRMPPRNYVSQHPDANLTDSEIQQLLDGLRATIKNDPAGGK